MAAEPIENQQAEVDRNYAAFQVLLPTIIQAHRGKFALMQNTEIKGYYSSSADARTTAEKFLAGKPFSIQKVTDGIMDLGFFSHVAGIGHL